MGSVGFYWGDEGGRVGGNGRVEEVKGRRGIEGGEGKGWLGDGEER